jgi:hypothetical protein
MMRIDETPNNTYQDVAACLGQLKAIADQRNKLVHRMVDYAGSHLKVSNALTAKSLAAIEADVFRDRDLQNMTMDCQAIFNRLCLVIAPSHNGEFEALVRAMPWHYKPPSEKRQRRRRS